MLSYPLSPAIPGKQVRTTGEKFYQATTYNVLIDPEVEAMILSSNAEGQGEFYIDDQVEINLTTNDNEILATWRHDFSNGCSGRVTPLPPLNLFEVENFSRFRGQVVNVQIQCSDLCGGIEGGTPLFLTFA